MDQSHLSKFSKKVMNVGRCLFRRYMVIGGNPVCQFLAGAPYLKKEPQFSAKWIEHVDRVKVCATSGNRNDDRFARDITGDNIAVPDVTDPCRIDGRYQVSQV